MADKKPKRDIDAIIALFLLGTDAEDAFSGAIYDARLIALQGAYQSAADDIGIDVSDWEPPDALLKQMARESKANGASIVETYNTDLRSAAERFAEQYQGDALKSELQAWTLDRAIWKSASVARYEASKGYSAGIESLVSDVLSGDADLPDGMSLSDITLIVEPSDAAETLCADLVAGNPYPIDAADDILGGVFPCHVGCVHYITVQTT